MGYSSCGRKESGTTERTHALLGGQCGCTLPGREEEFAPGWYSPGGEAKSQTQSFKTSQGESSTATQTSKGGFCRKRLEG